MKWVWVSVQATLAHGSEHQVCGTLYSAERRCKRQNRVSHSHRTSSNQCDPAALFCSLALFLFTATRDSVGQGDAPLPKPTMKQQPYAQLRAETHIEWDCGGNSALPQTDISSRRLLCPLLEKEPAIQVLWYKLEGHEFENEWGERISSIYLILIRPYGSLSL
jgi:hypothetical protein